MDRQRKTGPPAEKQKSKNRAQTSNSERRSEQRRREQRRREQKDRVESPKTEPGIPNKAFQTAASTPGRGAAMAKTSEKVSKKRTRPLRSRPWGFNSYQYCVESRLVRLAKHARRVRHPCRNAIRCSAEHGSVSRMNGCSTLVAFGEGGVGRANPLGNREGFLHA